MQVHFKSETVTCEIFKRASQGKYEDSLLPNNDEVTFYLRNVRWIDLFPAMSLLIWSSKLRNCGKCVIWRLPTGQVGFGEESVRIRSDLRFRMSEDPFDRLERRIERSMKARHRDYQSMGRAFQEIRKEYLAKHASFSGLLAQYFDEVGDAISRLRFVAFLERWDFLKWGKQIGVEFDPDWRTIPFHAYSRAESPTGSLSVKCIASYDELTDLVEKINKPEQLADIFEQYSNLDMFTSGSFAHIILRELGTNICEHAIYPDESCDSVKRGRYGFIATRLLRRSDIARRSTEPIAPAFFKQCKRKDIELLEIVIADDGPGICRWLKPWMQREMSANKRFKSERTKSGNFLETVVLKHCFDRLASSKRDFIRLIHCFPNREAKDAHDEEDRIASGLHWISRTVSSYQGLLVLRSDHTMLWYDSMYSNGNSGFRFDTSFPMGGVQFSIYLPLLTTETSRKRYFSHRSLTYALPSPRIEVSWFGHIKPSSTSLSRQEIARIIDDLKTRYLGMGPNGVFAVDLSGIHAPWINKDLVFILAHFFIELNYKSDSGNSAVVLWNLPSRWEKGLIRPILSDEINKIVEQFPHLVSLRPVSLLIWDNETFEVMPRDIPTGHEQLRRRISLDAAIMDHILACLDGQFEMAIDDLWESLSRDMKGKCYELVETKGQLAKQNQATVKSVIDQILNPLVRRNSHLIHLQGQTCSLRNLKENIEIAAQKTVEHDVKKCTECVIGSEAAKDVIGVLRKSEDTETWYHLPSGAYSQEFYQFSVMLSDTQWLARVAWWFSKVIRDHYQKTIDGDVVPQIPDRLYLITITRSTTPLLSEIKICLDKSKIFTSRHTIIETLSELTLDRMEQKLGATDIPRDKRIEVVLITDVISRGTLVGGLCQLCSEVIKVKPGLVITILDTRIKDDREAYKISGISVHSMHKVRVKKLHDSQHIPKNARIMEIDDVNVCPVDPDRGKLNYPRELGKRKRERQREFFAALALSGEPAGKPMCQVGHFAVSNYHHYTFYLDSFRFFNYYRPKDHNRCLLDMICDRIVSDFDKTCFPQGEREVQKIVALYPDPQVSKSELIVRKLQSKLGFTQSLILYRDRAVRTWIFTPFIEHGIGIRGKYVLIIDDGCCSGQTLMAMISCALHNRAKKILGYFFVNRMSMASTQYFEHTYARRRNVKVQFIVPFHIPVFDPQLCPLCGYKTEIDLVTERYPIPALREYCDMLRQKIQAVEVIGADRKNRSGGGLPWPVPEVSATVHLRQALELSSLVSSERAFLFERIMSIRKWTKESKAQLLLDERLVELVCQFAYLIVTEPRVLENRVVDSPENMQALINSLSTLLKKRGVNARRKCLCMEALVNILEHLTEKGRIFGLDEYARRLWDAASATENGVRLLSFLIARGGLRAMEGIVIHSREMYMTLFTEGLERSRLSIEDTTREFSEKKYNLIWIKGLLLFCPRSFQSFPGTEEDKKRICHSFETLHWDFEGHGRQTLDENHNHLLGEINKKEPDFRRLRKSIDIMVEAMTATEVLAFLQVAAQKYRHLGLPSYEITTLTLSRLSNVVNTLGVFYYYAFRCKAPKGVNIEEMAKVFKDEWPNVLGDLNAIVEYYGPDIVDKLKKFDSDVESYLPVELRDKVSVRSIPGIQDKPPTPVFIPDGFLKLFIYAAFDNLKKGFLERDDEQKNEVGVIFDDSDQSTVTLKIQDNGRGVDKKNEKQKRYRIMEDFSELVKAFGGKLYGPRTRIVGGCEIVLSLRKCKLKRS